MDKKKQRKYHARDRTKKYQKKRNELRYAKDRKEQRFAKDRREQRGTVNKAEDSPKIERRKRMKKRISNKFAAKLRYDTELKPLQNVRDGSESTSSTSDDTSKAITTEAVLSGRKVIYKSRRFSQVFRDKAKPEALKQTDQSLKPKDKTPESPMQDSPMQGNTKHDRNHRIQKNMQKREYIRNYRDAKKGISPAPWEKGAGIFQKGNTTKSNVLGKLAEFFENKNKYGIVIAVVLMALVLVVTLSSVGIFAGGVLSVLASTTYPSTDADISDTDSAYTALEEALNSQINAMETTHLGYDEYRYQVDEISHNPYELISYFTVKYGQFTYEDVKDELKILFGRQYTLRVWEETEIRTRTVTKTGTRTVTDPETGEEKTETYTYEEEEEYEYRILNISLTNKGIRALAAEDFTPEKLNLFDTYTTLHGNRDGIFDESMLPAEVDRYEIPPEALSDERFRRMITEAEKYLGYPYVWGGSSPSTSFDCSGFVSYVLNHCGNGWDVGRSTAEGLRNTSAYVSPSEAKPGDLIFFQGTYNTSGASHVGIYVGDGMMIHCGNPIQYANINTPYWQNHFYQFGRMP